MSSLLVLACALLPLVFPPWQKRLFSLEWGEDRGENTFRWAQFLIVFFLVLFSIDTAGQEQSGISMYIRWLIVALSYAEIFFRLGARYLLPYLGGKNQFAAKIYRYLTENPDNLYYSNYVPHPFLQFTGPRGPVPGTEDDRYLGFRDITLSERHKPEGVIRIACLGGSTTADGYPEMLANYLARELPEKNIQVLNFGMMWWSSVHSTVNYILNVIDYQIDFLVLHDSCNDHHYRGFAGLRGDCSHAYRLFLIPQTIGETLYRFSLLYRITRIALTWKFPARFRPRFEMKDIGLHSGKTFNYTPEELYIIERNIETVCTIAREQGSTVCLTTMPLSGVKKFSDEHDRVYRPHTTMVNEMIRRKVLEFGTLLADFDKLMTGREEFFNDAVHASMKGNRMKAKTVGTLLLEKLRHF